MSNNDVRESVKDYYGKELSKSEDLKTNACCTIKKYPKDITEAMSKIHDEVMSKYYGCGLTIPTRLEGCKILDLGSGSGRDCYLAAQLVGETGEVVGVDMTDEQLDVANSHIDYHSEKFGFKKSNVKFLKGYLEELDKLDIKDSHFDVIVSNCVINLVNDKQAVLNSVFKKLKEGGEFYFSDVYSNRRIPQHLVDDPVLYGECLSGALYVNDFITMAKKAGFVEVRAVEEAPITIENSDLQNKVNGYTFTSITYRLFKIAKLDSLCEDYGQAVIYKGGITNNEESFLLDENHYFLKGKTELICGNTYRMLNETRFKDHFEFIGTWDKHYGIYNCGKGTTMLPAKVVSSDTEASCC